MAVLIALLAAALPTALYSLLLWWLDRYEKEPLPLVFAAFWWGAIPAIALAVAVEFLLAVPLEGSPIGPHVSNWGVVPLVEELFKALALVGLYVWARREFDGPLDGIVYGALIGFGFSMTENMLYFISYGDTQALFWLRGLLFGMNHAFFTSMTGLGFGVARRQRNPVRGGLALAGGFGLAALFHAIHNYFVSSDTTASLALSWLVQSGGVIVILLIAVMAWREERATMQHELRDEVASGMLTPEEYAEITSSAKRLRRQSEALLLGGWNCFVQVRRLHQATTELAFCKSRVRQADRHQCCDEPEQLRAEIRARHAALKQAGFGRAHPSARPSTARRKP